MNANIFTLFKSRFFKKLEESAHLYAVIFLQKMHFHSATELKCHLEELHDYKLKSVLNMCKLLVPLSG